MSSSTLVLPLLLLASIASAGHYYGGSLTFTPKGRNADGSFRVDFHIKETYDWCINNNIWRCSSGNCGYSNRNEYGIVDQSTNGRSAYFNNWCQSESVVTRNIPSNRPFQMRDSSCCWVPTVNHVGSWSLLTHVDLGVRSDTNEPNRSPVTTILSFIRVPQNCQRTYYLMAFDPDNDQVRCRYGNLHTYECNRCSQHSGFYLNQGACSLQYGYTSRRGVHGFELVLEDFPRQHITLSYTDGSQAHRGPLGAGRRRRSASHYRNPSWWQTTPQPTHSNSPWQPTTTTQPTTQPNSTPQPSTASPWWWHQPNTTPSPWWWRHQPNSTPQPSTASPWWWHQPNTTPSPWWWRHQPNSTPQPSTASPWWWHQPNTTPSPWWWRHQPNSTPQPSTASPWWWHQPNTTPSPWWWPNTTPSPPTTATTATTARSTPYWWLQSTTRRPTTTTMQTPSTTAAPQTTTPYFMTTSAHYASTTPLSKLPLQFSLLVDPPAPSCTEGVYLPRFLPPTPHNGERLHAAANQELEIRVKATATISAVDDVIISGPLNITKHRITTGEFVIRWTPTKDDLGSHFPICYIAEGAVGSNIYQSDMRCVIVDVGRRTVQANVICTENIMTVEVEKVSAIGLHEDHLRLNDPSCTLYSNGTHVLARMSIDTCGTIMEEDDESLIFRNEIVSFDDASDVITRRHEVEIEFYCKYPKKSNVTLEFDTHRPTHTFVQKGIGAFTYQFELFETSQFYRRRNPNSYPLEYTLGEMMYMEIEATSSLNNTELFAESCSATPYDDPNYHISYSIIENGCIKDETVQFYSNHESKIKFGMKAFKFIGLHDQVFISCSVILCEAGNPYTRCSQGCTNATAGSSGHRHHRREAPIQTASHYISQGPLRLRRSADRSVVLQSQTLNLNMVFIIGGLLAAVGMVCGVVIYKTRGSKGTYQRLPTSDI